MKLRRFIKWFCFLFLIILIFYLSHQQGADSQNLSNKFVVFIEKYISISWLSHFIVDLSFFVRKSAHFWLYFCLGVSTILLFQEYGLMSYKLIFFSIFFCFLYAISDEIHQLFVIGRSGKFIDVLLDTAGSSFGVFVISFSQKLYKKIRFNH